MSAVQSISSASQLSTIISKNTIVIIDFTATWCGPCRAISPIFETLATKHAKTPNLAFAKCDVDACSDIARAHSVRAMPTFVVLQRGSEVDRITGADRGALMGAVEKWAGAAGGGGSAAGGGFGKGHKLGGDPAVVVPPLGGGGGLLAAGEAVKYVLDGRVIDSLPIGARARGMLRVVIVFLGLYFTSLFSFDAIPAAENSMFASYGKPRDQQKKPGLGGFGGAGRPGGPPPPPGPPGSGSARKLGTVDSIRSSGGCSDGSCG
ncbi:thioredoxin-like protein [Tuber brumale]|nr:thioredoxin-like protein [Tuber brumale]